MRLAHRAASAIDHDRHRVAAVVDEHLLAAGVALPHDQRQPAFPAAEQIAPAAVAIAVRMDGDIFLPEHLERDVLALQLARHHRPVRLGLLAPPRLHPRHPIQACFQLGVGHVRRHRPGKPRTLEPLHHVAHRRARNSHPASNLPDRKRSFSRYSLIASRASRILALLVGIHSLQLFGCRKAWAQRSGSSPPRWAEINRNGGRDQFGIPGGNSSEWWAASSRNPHVRPHVPRILGPQSDA